MPNSKRHLQTPQPSLTTKKQKNNPLPSSQHKANKTNFNMLANRNKPKTKPQPQENISLPSWLPPSPLNPELFTSDSVETLHNAYQTALPYRHVQLPKLCTHDAMTKIQREIIDYLPTSSRETDLFKVNQSIDLNNVDFTSDFAKNIPTLL